MRDEYRQRLAAQVKKRSLLARFVDTGSLYFLGEEESMSFDTLSALEDEFGPFQRIVSVSDLAPLFLGEIRRDRSSWWSP